MLETVISNGQFGPGSAAVPIGQAADPISIARLVPHSGVQIVDLELPTDGLDQVQLSFAEHRYAAAGGFRSVLLPLERIGSGDVAWHPVSQRALAPDEITSISGTAALEAFAGRWVPVPYLRLLGRDADGGAALDAGPENWARIFISASPRDASSARIALAFDTRLEAADRSGEKLYLAPTADDALLGASFRLANGTDAARFASRPWIDAWLRNALAPSPSGTEAPARRAMFDLDHVARYLVLIDALSRLSVMPEVRFLDTLGKRWPAPVADVDLVLDIGSESTAAMLFDHEVEPPVSALASATELALRNLSEPVSRRAGPIPTQVEFAPQPFGDAGLSRLSGRADAFVWPSLARIGEEARALALKPTATSGVTGQTGLMSLLGQTEPSDDAWRVGGDGSGAGPVVSGALLAHLAEDGTALSVKGSARSAAVRPRFAPASLMTFFLAELLLHAISAINAIEAAPPDPHRTVGARRLRRIVVTVASGVAEVERERLLAHTDAAIDLIWCALGWDEAQELGAPPRPAASLSAGTDVAAQVFRLRREIATRFAGDAQEFLDAIGGQEAAAADAVVRVASVELGRSSSSATVVDYAVEVDGALAPRQAVVDHWDAGGEALTEAFAQTFVLPAIAAALTGCGLKVPDLFLSRALDTTTARPSAERHLARRLRSKVILPAAAALIDIARTLPPRIASGQRTYSLRALVARGGGRLDPQSRHFDAQARHEGAAGFSLDKTELRVSQRQLGSAIQAAAAATVERVVDLASRHACDLVLVSGDLASLPAVAEGLVARLPIEPSRMIGAGARDLAEPEDAGAAAAGSLEPCRLAGLAGAYLAGRGTPALEAFRRVVAEVGRDATRPMPRLVEYTMHEPATSRLAETRALTHQLVEARPRAARAAERVGGGEP